MRRLPLAEPGAPPATRAGCAEIVRPCTRYLCRHNLAVDDERAGRPHHGVPPPPVIRPKAQSCALDVAERGALSYRSVGELLMITRQRAEQIVARAARKLAAHAAVLAAVEDLELPRGSRATARAVAGGGTNRAVAIVEVVHEPWSTAASRDDAAVAVGRALVGLELGAVALALDVAVPSGAQPVVFTCVFTIPDVATVLQPTIAVRR